MLEELGAPGAIKGGVLMGLQVVKKFGRPYQMDIMSGQRSSCSPDTKCDTCNSVYSDLGDLYTYKFLKIEFCVCSQAISTGISRYTMI